ncbi:hypothetical protein AGMMS4956_00260 [Bacteroidia bacterium]|nr:hypothetical protein AGMMS4956_00260 [Bacteroidia bacterium]
MVFYSSQADDDLQNIFDGLLQWKTQNGQIHMDFLAVEKYLNDILDVCDGVESITFHLLTKYIDHQQYGNYVVRYKRNRRTTWYIIYNIQGNDFFIEKIMNNYQTLSEINKQKTT